MSFPPQNTPFSLVKRAYGVWEVLRGLRPIEAATNQSNLIYKLLLIGPFAAFPYQNLIQSLMYVDSSLRGLRPYSGSKRVLVESERTPIPRRGVAVRRLLFEAQGPPSGWEWYEIPPASQRHSPPTSQGCFYACKNTPAFSQTYFYS